MANLNNTGSTVTYGQAFNKNHTHRTASEMSALPGLDQRFSQMSLASHQTNLCDVLLEMVGSMRNIAQPDQVDNFNKIEDKLKPMFENYRNQVSSVNSQHANSCPKIEFIEPLWTMKDVTKWQTIEKRYDPYFRNLRGDPRNIGGGIHIDTREDKEEDAWNEEHFQNTGERLRVMLEAEPAEASVPEVHERLDDHGIVLNAYQPAVLAKPAIPARRGYPKIINGNPIAFSGPVNHKTEAGLITYLTESEEKTGDKIDMVQTCRRGL